MKKKNIPLIIVILLCVVSLVVMAFALTRQPEAIKGEFTPPPFDPAAVVGVPEVPEDLGYRELDCEVYKVALCGKLNRNGDLWLTNPESNEVWLKVRALDEKGNILGETGLVKPGEYVRSVNLTKVPQSGTPVTLKIMAYEPETYYSAGAASLNTFIQ